jgi:antitoxin (DNA-binding transcriptional repressor) of toxin-antitoxin stability system
MKRITIRDLRQRWPEAEEALKVEESILITRDSKPVARLVRYTESQRARKRFDPAAQLQWQRRMSGGATTRWVEEGLLRERDER